MNEPLLLVDLGNSRVKWAWARGGAIDEASLGQGGAADFAAACTGWDGAAPVAVRLSSVAAGERRQEIVEVCAAAWGIAVQVLQTRDGQGGVRCGYADPSRLGVDRWLAVVGAATHHGLPVVAWDLGTATTLDAVDASGWHLGGWILPGPSTMTAALGAHTQLPRADAVGDGAWDEPGRATAEAIGRGILAAQLGAMERFVARVAARVGEQPRLVVTGGAAGLMLPLVTDLAAVHDPLLVFRGMLVD